MVQAVIRPLPYPVRVPDHEPPDTPTPAGGADASPPEMSSVRSVPYKGADLDAARGPGLGCFRFQLILLVVLVFATPLSVNAGAPDWLSAGLLFATIALLLVAGQTIIFLLRLVAADRRGRRRPLASATPTIGELEDRDAAASTTELDPRPDDHGMRQ
jgi:hypothetical protein